MTKRKYYDDSYTWQFGANVVEVSSDSATPFAILDASYFYPTSGGQPHDLGTLGGANVVDVGIRASDGSVIHTLDAPVTPGPIAASIDGRRRFDHMQHHTGQHILSQAFIRTANAATIGFHLGVETVTIDLDDASLTEARVAEAAEVANAVVSGNVAVRAWFPEQAEIDSLPLRKVPDVDGALRVVSIGDFDYSACGGTHVARTGEVGQLAVLRVERMKRGTRIEFLAGHRARADYARKHALLQKLSAATSCATADLPDAVGRLSSALAEARRALASYQERDLDDEARQLALSGSVNRGVSLIQTSFADRPVDEVKGLALRLTTGPDVVALLGTTGARTQLVFARSENLTVDLKPAFDSALAKLGGGKGGGGRVLMGAAGSVQREVLAGVLRDATSTLVI